MACRYYHKKHTNRTEIYDVLKKVFSVLKFIGVGEEGGVHALYMCYACYSGPGQGTFKNIRLESTHGPI